MCVPKLPLLVALKSLLSQEYRPDGYVFRYLNDDKNPVKQVFRSISNIAACYLFKLIGVKVGWICHNVDKETSVHWPFCSSLVRAVLARSADRVYVTSSLLVEKIVEIYPQVASKVDVVTFGIVPESNSAKDHYSASESRQDINILKGRRIFLSLNSALSKKKVEEIIFSIKIAKTLIKNDSDALVVLAGEMIFELKESYPTLWLEIERSKEICVIPGLLLLHELRLIAKSVCLIKCYSDYSIPLGIFQAANYGIPVLSVDGTFIASVVRKYNIGQNVSDGDNLIDVLEALIMSVNHYDFQDFLAQHSWCRGSAALCRLVE